MSRIPVLPPAVVPPPVAGAANIDQMRHFALTIDNALLAIVPAINSIAEILFTGSNTVVKVDLRGVLNAFNILCTIGDLGLIAVVGQIPYNEAKSLLLQYIADVVSNIQPLSQLKGSPNVVKNANNALVELHKLKNTYKPVIKK
jgi:hypothetical protein